MYLNKSLKDGLKILKFSKAKIKQVSKEKNLEEMFLVNLFMNYLIVLVLFFVILLTGGIVINKKVIDTKIFFSLLLLYPFAYNLIMYSFFGFYGLLAEYLNSIKKIKPLLAVGYHVSLVYSLIIYIIFLIYLINQELGIFLFISLFIYFIYTLFVILKVIYNLKGNEVAMVLLLFLLFIASVYLVSYLVLPVIEVLLSY